MAPERRYVSGPGVCARFDISAMTLWRWQRNPELNFPLPIVINGRKYWALDELERGTLTEFGKLCGVWLRG